MELKTYQKEVIADLKRYLELLGETNSLKSAWSSFWNEKGVKGIEYRNTLPKVANVCLKVPTGGGKTFIACNAVAPIFRGLPPMKIKAVVWLVPSESILSQTLKSLKDPDHPYRQRLNSDFGSRVEVYSKDELLNGQNFNSTTVTEQLSVMVLSYDSFKRNEKTKGYNTIKSKRENASLAPMAKALGPAEVPVESADETSLIQTINKLNPLVIVDESHHAGTALSRQMLKDFNPCFVLELTATPRNDSNILCYVGARRLKRENMVKLPVLVFKRNDPQSVLIDAIDLRNRLEEYAAGESVPIRPIVLFQAEPKVKDDSTTFEKLKEKLIAAGIPAEQIAIKTADINELKKVDLMDPACPIRYIITINALKEGWDCPFAYVLASLANKSSKVDVEQILGRILRQPYTRRLSKKVLNMCYVLSSSNSFDETLQGIISGLNGAGFSGKEYRLAEISEAVPEVEGEQKELRTAVPTVSPSNDQKSKNTSSQQNTPADSSTETSDDIDNINSDTVKTELNKRQESGGSQSINTMLENAADQEKTQTTETGTEETEQETSEDDPAQDLPPEVKQDMKCYGINDAFKKEIEKIRLPQFFHQVEESIFNDGYSVLLTKEHLSEGFTLKGKPTEINFKRAENAYKIDAGTDSDDAPKAMKLTDNEQHLFSQYFTGRTSEEKRRICKETIYNNIDNKKDDINAGELKAYIDIIIGNMDADTLAELEKSPRAFAKLIDDYIEKLLDAHREKKFKEWLETGEVTCVPAWEFPKNISPTNVTNIYGRSLYQAEEEPNSFEKAMIVDLTAMENIEWWHRNLSRKGFCINGFINHYPDFIVRTKKGKIVLIETKGDHLDNEESRQKLALGRRWQDMAGPVFRYFMIFQNQAPQIEGAYTMNRFLEILKQL